MRALNVHPYALRVLSAGVLCYCGFTQRIQIDIFAQHNPTGSWFFRYTALIIPWVKEKGKIKYKYIRLTWCQTLCPTKIPPRNRELHWAMSTRHKAAWIWRCLTAYPVKRERDACYLPLQIQQLNARNVDDKIQQEFKTDFILKAKILGKFNFKCLYLPSDICKIQNFSRSYEAHYKAQNGNV